MTVAPDSTLSPAILARSQSFSTMEVQQQQVPMIGARTKGASVSGAGLSGGRMSVVSHGSWRFVIFDAPREDTVNVYCEDLALHGVKHIVRACDATTYSADTMKSNGITVHEINFDDGASPDSKVLERWRNVLHLVEKEALATASPGADPIKAIGVHCVAGLGRSPTLVAIALMDMGMNCLDCVEEIRKRRRGAINAKQLEFLLKYRPVRRSLLSTIKGLLKRG